MALNEFRFIISFVALYIIMVLLQIYRNKTKRFSEVVCRIQVFSLLVYSCIFIAIADIRFLACVMIMTFVVWLIAKQIEKRALIKQKKIFLAIGVFVGVFSLLYFKYCNFFLEELCRMIKIDKVTLNIILPLGISFYSFSAIAYLIDVYREKYSVEKNFINFTLYMMFFPKITCGPIVRGKEFIPQIKKYRGLTIEDLMVGMQIFVFGMFKKLVLADHLGVFVDDVFYAPNAFHTVSVILAVFSYSMQIYFDFSGYSDMAIGIAKMLGIEFSANFNLPYVAQSVPEFWKRWHISLSSWFQEYLYYPLGGNRKGEIRTQINLIIVMLLSGLWHGAGETFVIWGFAYGLLSCVYKICKRRDNIHKEKAFNCFVSGINVVVTFITVSLLWVVFRATDIQNAVDVLRGVFFWREGIVQIYTWTIFSGICLLGATMVATIRAKKMNSAINGFYPVLDLKKFWSQVIFFTFVGLTIMLGYYGNNVFIYGKF